MNRIPIILLFVLILALMIRFLPEGLPASKPIFKKILLPLCILTILYLTILSRFMTPKMLFDLIFNRHYIPDQEVIVGTVGSEWNAEQVGISGFQLFLIGLNDPNSRLYIIPSTILNILMLMPAGMLFMTSSKLRKMKTSVSLWLCGGFILIIEILQRVFYLGKFDLLDIIFGVLGFYLGRKLWLRYLSKPWIS